MGLFDFGDREMVKTSAMRIGIGLQQLEQAHTQDEIRGMSYAVAGEVRKMIMLASRLTLDSRLSLKVPYKGRKILYPDFLNIIRQASNNVLNKGGFSLL